MLLHLFEEQIGFLRHHMLCVRTAHGIASDRVGFKVALHSHTDKPMMQFSSQLINVGTETHVNLILTISYT